MYLIHCLEMLALIIRIVTTTTYKSICPLQYNALSLTRFIATTAWPLFAANSRRKAETMCYLTKTIVNWHLFWLPMKNTPDLAQAERRQRLCAASVTAADASHIIAHGRHLRSHFVCLPDQRLMPGIKNKACTRQQGAAAACSANGAPHINHILLLWLSTRRPGPFSRAF